MSDNKTGWDANSVPSNPDTIAGESVVPSSPTRPGRNVSDKTRRQGEGMLLPIVLLLGFIGLGYGIYVAAFDKKHVHDLDPSAAVGSAVEASKRAARAAKAALETKVRQPEHARKGQRDKTGPALAEEEKEARERHEQQRKELAARGLTPPLQTSEIDKTFARAKGAIGACYKKHYPKLGNFKRVRVDADIDASGKVTGANLVEEEENEALNTCVSAAVKRLRFRGQRESNESHQMFLVLGKHRSLKK